MRVAYIAAGAAGTICGNCLRDNALAAAMMERGHDVFLIPTYTPIRTDERDVSQHEVYVGGVNIYLQQKYPLFRKLPRFATAWMDSPSLLRWISSRGMKTQPADLGELTVATLRGVDGPAGKEMVRLAEAVADLKPDVVHITNSMLSAVAPAIRERCTAPIVCSLQGEDYFLEQLPEPFSGQAFALLRGIVPSVDCFLAPSQDQAAGFAPRLGLPVDDIPVIYTGVSLDGFRARHPRTDGPFTIGYLARVAPEKAPHLLVDAFYKLRTQIPDAPHCRLRIAGWLAPEHQSYVENIQRRISGWGLTEDFEYVGEVTRDQKLDFYESLDALCVPALYRAPKGLYVLEALAAGVPVVQPHSGCFPELIEHTGGGLLHEPRNVDDLAAKLLELMHDRERANELGAQGRAAVHDRFHSGAMAAQTLALYEKLTGNATRAAEPAT